MGEMMTFGRRLSTAAPNPAGGRSRCVPASASTCRRDRVPEGHREGELGRGRHVQAVHHAVTFQAVDQRTLETGLLCA